MIRQRLLTKVLRGKTAKRLNDMLNEFCSNKNTSIESVSVVWTGKRFVGFVSYWVDMNESEELIDAVNKLQEKK